MSDIRRPYDLHLALQSLRLDPSSTTPHESLRSEVIDLLQQAEGGGVILDMLDTDWASAPRPSEAELAQAEAHVLLVWCDDLDGCSLVAIPTDSPLAADARAVDRLCFADGSDCRPHQLGAAVRLIAAQGLARPEAVFAGWRAELDHVGPEATGVGSADDLVAVVGALRGGIIGSAAAFHQRIVEIYSVNKAS